MRKNIQGSFEYKQKRLGLVMVHRGTSMKGAEPPEGRSRHRELQPCALCCKKPGTTTGNESSLQPLLTPLLSGGFLFTIFSCSETSSSHALKPAHISQPREEGRDNGEGIVCLLTTPWVFAF